VEGAECRAVTVTAQRRVDEEARVCLGRDVVLGVLHTRQKATTKLAFTGKPKLAKENTELKTTAKRGIVVAIPRKYFLKHNSSMDSIINKSYGLIRRGTIGWR
jgi:hypothetical protein